MDKYKIIEITYKAGYKKYFIKKRFLFIFWINTIVWHDSYENALNAIKHYVELELSKKVISTKTIYPDDNH